MLAKAVLIQHLFLGGLEKMNYKQVRHSNCEVFEELEQQWNEDSASVVNPFFKGPLLKEKRECHSSGLS